MLTSCSHEVHGLYSVRTQSEAFTKMVTKLMEERSLTLSVNII